MGDRRRSCRIREPPPSGRKRKSCRSRKIRRTSRPFSEWTFSVLFAVNGQCSLSARLPAGETRVLNPPLRGVGIVRSVMPRGRRNRPRPLRAHRRRSRDDVSVRRRSNLSCGMPRRFARRNRPRRRPERRRRRDSGRCDDRPRTSPPRADGPCWDLRRPRQRCRRWSAQCRGDRRCRDFSRARNDPLALLRSGDQHHDSTLARTLLFVGEGCGF